MRLPDRGRGGKELAKAFLDDQPSHGSDDDGVVRDAQLGANGGAALTRYARGVEVVEVDAVSEQPRLRPGDEPPPKHPLEVLLALIQLEVGAESGQALEPTGRRTASRNDPEDVAYSPCTVLTTHGTLASPRSETPEHAHFGRVRMDEVEALTSEDARAARGTLASPLPGPISA